MPTKNHDADDYIPLTKIEISELRAINESWKRSKWLGGISFKLLVGIGAVTTALIQFKTNIIAILKGMP